MSEYKPITDGLRSSMKRVQIFGSPFVQKEAIYFDQICDNIDSIHANLERENESLKAELDRARGEWDFWESTHVELPKDADGEYVHIGDKVTEHEDGHTFKVDGFMDWDGEWWVFMRDGVQAPAIKCTHCHATTVEDVLRQFADEVYADADNEIRDRDFLCAKYAKRLTLAGDAE